MPDYSYLPLRQNDAIRLLELLPGTRDDPQVHCNITRRRLSDKSLRYEAISYTWGNSENRETLLCGGFRAELSITRNCYNALCSLRQAAQPRLLWIDAVCINQDDISERNAQVRIMDQIYANATQVVAYLGEESAGSHILFHELALADHLYQSTGSFEGRPKPSIETVNELELLLQRPWWFRIWVLQEVHVARQVTAMCGNSQASMKALDGCVFGYRYNRVTERFAPPPLYAFDNGWYFKPTRNQRDVAVFTLWQLLWTTRACKATDPRDRVLALIPFLTETRHELAHLIDYSRTVEQIFTDVALFLVDYLGLLVLGAVQHPHAREMPSWVADWSGDSVSTAWGSKDEPPITTERGFTVCRLACYHKACKGQHPVLRVQGVRIARIGHLGGHFDFENAREQCWETIRQVLDLQQVTSGYVPNEIDQGYNNDYGVMLTPLIYGSKYDLQFSLATRTCHY